MCSSCQHAHTHPGHRAKIHMCSFFVGYVIDRQEHVFESAYLCICIYRTYEKQVCMRRYVNYEVAYPGYASTIFWAGSASKHPQDKTVHRNTSAFKQTRHTWKHPRRFTWMPGKLTEHGLCGCLKRFIAVLTHQRTCTYSFTLHMAHGGPKCYKAAMHVWDCHPRRPSPRITTTQECYIEKYVLVYV